MAQINKSNEGVDPFDLMMSDLTKSSTVKIESVVDDNDDLFSDNDDLEDEKHVDDLEDDVDDNDNSLDLDKDKDKDKDPKGNTDDAGDITDLSEYESDIAKFVSVKLSEKLGEDLGEFESIDNIIDKLAEIVEESSIPEFASDDVKKIDEYVRNGGDLRKYYSDVYEDKLNLDDIDIQEERDQKRIIKESLKSSGYSDTQIKRKIERYEESGVLEEEAEEALEIVREVYRKNEKKLLETQENNKKETQKRQQKFISNVQSTIKDIKDIAGTPISEKDKKELLPYLLNVGKDGKTAYQRDYENDLAYNFIISAFFTKNKDKLLKKAEKVGASKLAKELQEKLAQKGKRMRSSSTSGGQEVDALELFSKQLRR